MTILGILCFGIRIYRRKIHKNRLKIASNTNLNEHTDQVSMDTLRDSSNSPINAINKKPKRIAPLPPRATIDSSISPGNAGNTKLKRIAPLPPRAPIDSSISPGNADKTKPKRIAPLPPRGSASPQQPPGSQVDMPTAGNTNGAKPPRRKAPPPPPPRPTVSPHGDVVPSARPDDPNFWEEPGSRNSYGFPAPKWPSNPPPAVPRSPTVERPPPYLENDPGSSLNVPSSVRKRRSYRSVSVSVSSKLRPNENTPPNNVKLSTIQNHVLTKRSPVNVFESDSIWNVKSSDLKILSKLDHKLGRNNDESNYIRNELSDNISEHLEGLNKVLSSDITYSHKGKTKRDLNNLKLRIFSYNNINRRNNNGDM